MRHFVKSVICSTFCNVKLRNMNIAPLCTFFVVRFLERTAIVPIKRALIDLYNRDKACAVWDGKLLSEFNLGEFHYSEDSLLYLLFSSAAYLCSIVSCDYSNTVFLFMFLSSQTGGKNWKWLRLLFHTVQRLNKVLYVPLLLWFRCSKNKRRICYCTYKVGQLLEQFLLCISDFSIMK
jgi:hypothetical protein